jgi:type II secretory pathway pseudopilin PulG
MIELIAALVIVGIIMALAAKRLSAVVTQQRVARAASALQNDIEAAFAISARNRRPMRMAWNAGAMTFTVEDRTGTPVYRTTQLGGSTYGLLSGEVTASSTPIEIFPNGLAADTLLITISASRGTASYSRRVHVSLAGLVRID